MKTVERLALFVGVVILITALGTVSQSAVRDLVFGASEITADQMRLWATVRIWLLLLVNFACGAWLFIATSKTQHSTWIWSLFGFCTGLNGVMVYYLVAIYYRLYTEDSNLTDSDGDTQVGQS